MSPAQAVRQAQRAWALAQGIPLDSRGYVLDLESNLREPLSAHAWSGFRGGSGSELESHMKALHSSSALVANVFNHWTGRYKAPLLYALGVEGGDPAVQMDFEAQFSTGLGGTPPNLDVAIWLNSGALVAVESKFTEHMTRSTRGKADFSSSYFPLSGGLWADVGLPRCQRLAKMLRDGDWRPEFLDPGQLLKHVLGLAKQGNRFTLCYLYFDCAGERSDAHREEVQSFAAQVGEEIQFRALTYQGMFSALSAAATADAESVAYLEYLSNRYFSGF